jgi:hypothetical protein
VKRVEDIYDDPEFFVDGATANDVKQGMNGDCWFLAAITALSGKPELIEKLCVHRDEKVGVYGFVFFRGETLLFCPHGKMEPHANFARRWRMDI